MKRLLAMALVLTASLADLGCGKDDPVKPEPAKPITYPDRSTPDNTLRRMAMAFSARDTTVTASVYDDAYEGSSTDMTEPSPVTLQFTKADEVKVVRALALSSTIARVSIELYSNSTWFHTHYLSDPDGWISIQVPNYRINVNDTARGEFEVNSPSPGRTEFFEFTLKPNTPDATSPTDTTWTIARWKEIVDY